MLKKLIVFTLSILCMCQVAFANELSAPQTDIYLVDSAGMFSADTKDKLLSTSKDLYNNTGAQFVIVTVSNLNGESIEEYSNDLFNNWGIGNKDTNNGVLLLISKEDRKFRIEAGSGLEGTLTDAYCHNELKILKDYFSKDDYDNGVLAVSNGICSSITNDEPVSNNENMLTTTQKELIVFVIILFIIILLIFISCGGGGGFIFFDSFGGGSSSGSSFGGGSSDGGGCSGDW